MFDSRYCLSPSNPDVKKWIDNVGKEVMYKVFVQNNYLLPDYESFIGAEEVFSKDIQDYKKFLDDLLPSNQYEYDVIDKLKSMGFNILGTAAFFKKTFYFRDKVTKNELAEEAFHSIVQTLMSDAEKTQIYNGGRELLNQRLKKEKRNFNDYITELKKLFPNVSKEILEQYAYEEEIAKDFVNYYNSEGKTNRYSQERINSLKNKLSFLGDNALPIAQLLHRFFERIKSLFNLTSNQKEVEMLFKKISNGGFKNTKIVNNNDNVIPSFAIYKNENNKIIPSDEISQMKRSIAVLAKNLNEAEGLKIDSEQAINQSIENYIGFLENQYDKVDENKFDLLDDLIALLYTNDEELIQEIKDQFEANKTIFDEVYEDNKELNEDEAGSSMSFEDGANQQSPESRSKELQILMNTTGVVKGKIFVDATGKTVAYQDLETSIITNTDGEVFEGDISLYKKIDILKIADEKMIYSAIIRKLTNTNDEKKRFLKLIQLSMYNPEVQTIKGKQDNQNTKTFIDRLLKDILGTADDFEELKKQTIKDLESNKTLSDIIKPESKPLHVQRFLLALRGFNLASRNVYRVELDIEKGWGKVSDVEAGSKKSVQKNYWDSNYRILQDTSYEQFKSEFGENFKQFKEEYKNEEKTSLELARIYNKILEQLGIDVNGEYLIDFMNKVVSNNYPILYTNKIFTLETLLNKLEAIKLKIEERDNYPDFYKGDDEEIEIGDNIAPKDNVDFNSFLNFIAEGNIEYDERVIESSYKDGYGNSIYNHQLATFTLKFGNSFQSIEDFNQMRKGGIIGISPTLDENGKVQVIKSDILDSFKDENPLIDDLKIDGEISSERLKQVKLLTFDTTQLKSYSKKTKGGFLIEKDSEYSENNILGLDAMSDAEYALTNMVLYTEGAKQTLEVNGSIITAPISLGANEAAKTIDYFTIFHDKDAITLQGELGEKSKKRIFKLIKTEYDKIKQNSKRLKEQIEVLTLNPNFVQGKITRNNLFDLGVINVYEGYINGKYESKKDDAENVLYYKAADKKSFKGLQFSPEVAPFVNDKMLASALIGDEFDEKFVDFKTVMTFLNTEFDIIKSYGILDKLPSALRKSYTEYNPKTKKYDLEIETLAKNTNEIELFNPSLSEENRVKSFLLNYWLGSIMANRMRYGSHNFNFKIDSVDPLKRYKMFNGATLSAKTSIINKSLGINEPIDFITYTAIAEPKGISDINRDGKPIDRADAGMRATPEGVRRIFHGMSKLNQKISDVLDKEEQGVELTPEEWDVMVSTQSYISAMKPLVANGEQTAKVGLTPSLKVAFVAYDTIIVENDRKTFTGKKETFTFGNNKIKVDEYGRTTQTVGNTKEIIWDNTNKVFKEWKAKPIDSEYILYNQRMFLRGFRLEDGVWIYKGKQYEIDTLVPPTALKTSQRNILPFKIKNVLKSDGKSTIDIEETNFNFPKEYNNTYTFANAVDADYFGQQVDNPQGKVKITSPTQMIEILANEQFGEIAIKIFENGKLTEQKITNDDLQSFYQNLFARRNINGFSLSEVELFTEKEGNLVPNYTYFFEKLREGLKLTGGSGQDFEFLNVNEDGTPEYNVNIPLNKDKMIQYVLKHFSTGVLSHKVAGNSYVLASDHGMKVLKKLIPIRNKDKEIIDYTWEVVHRKTEGYNNLLVELAENNELENYDLSNKIYDHRAWDKGKKENSELHTWFEEQKERLNNGEDVYFVDNLRYMKKSYTKVGNEYVFNTWVSEAMMPKLNAKQKSIPYHIKFGTGVRIPSQDKQSAIGLEWVDFLDDTMGNTIVVPKEIVEISGSDFDIDKSYVTQYEGYWENGDFIKYEDTFEDYKKYLFKTSKPLKKALKEIGNEKEVLEKFRLISTEKEFKEETKKLQERNKNDSLNNAVMNNKILDAQRALLTSDSVLFEDTKNEARGTGDTPMDLALFENLQKDSIVSYAVTEDNKNRINQVYGKNIKVIEIDGKYNVYPFITIVDGKDVELLQVYKNDKIPHNSLSVHANYQQGTIIARQGIGTAVNGMLMAIVANRIGLQLTDKFKLYYNGDIVKFGFTNHLGGRVFEVKNTITTATTDEAKEGQLKKHGIKGDDLTVVDLLVSLEFSLDEAIAIVNSKYAKKYKNTISRNNLESFADKNKPKSKEEQEFEKLIQDLKSDNNDKVAITKQQIFEGLYQDDSDLLTVYLKVADMAKELGKVAKLIKGKKGYTKGKLSELTDIQKTATELGLIKSFDKEGNLIARGAGGYFDWSSLDTSKAEDIRSFVEITKKLTNDKLNKIFIEYEQISNRLKNAVLIESSKPDNVELSDKIEKDVNTFLIVQMLKGQNEGKYKYLQDFLDINKINPNNKVDNFVNKFFEKKKISKKDDTYKLLKHLIGVKGKVNTIKNSESIDSLRLAAVSKLNPAQQDNIRNLFLELLYSDNTNLEERKEEKEFAQSLFAYFVLKDGLQFRQFNISKIFPTEMFREISDVLNDFKTFTRGLDESQQKDLTNKFKQLWYSDIRNKKNRQKVKDSLVITPYRIVENVKKAVKLEDYNINQPALYLEINKNGESQEYTKSGIKYKIVEDLVVVKLPLYIDYKGASYKKLPNSNKIDVVTSDKTYKNLSITEVENELSDTEEKYELTTNSGKLVFTVIQSEDGYKIYDSNDNSVNVNIDFSKLADPSKVTYIREPYYGSTIIDMTVDAGVIPAASEVVGKNVSKLVDLIAQLEEEGTKEGYIQFYKNLLSKRYSPNFDKSYNLEVDNKPVRNPDIVEKLKQFETVKDLELLAWNKLTPEQKEIYKNDFTNRKLELQNQNINQAQPVSSETESTQNVQSEFDNFVDDVLLGNVDYKTSNPFTNIIELKEGSGFEVVNNIFKTKIDQFNYTYNSITKEVIYNSKTGDKVESNETQINKVLVQYALANNYFIKEFNKSQYVNIDGKVLNISNGNVVTQSQILELFSSSTTKTERKLNSEVESVNNKYELFPNVYANKDQEKALDLMFDFVSPKNKQKEFLLIGKGGTGKTTIVKKVVDNLIKQGVNMNSIFGVAPTHVAKKVLNKSFNGIINKNNVVTLASALGIKLDENTGEFEKDPFLEGISDKADYIILDESSMISDSLLDLFRSMIRSETKIIFMGDKGQLPPVGQDTDSKVFDINNTFELLEKMRQAATSPIINITEAIYKAQEEGNKNNNPISDNLRVNRFDEISGSSIDFLQNEKEFLQNYVNDLKSESDLFNTKIITFNNEKNNSSQSVKTLNNKVRSILFGSESEKVQFYKGEIITAYGKYKEDVNNGDNFVIEEIEEVKNKKNTITVQSRARGMRSIDTIFDIIYLSSKNDEDKIIEIPIIANSSKEEYEKILKDLWKKDTQLAFALSNFFGNIQYGYAITSHKSQGSTYKNVYVVEDNILGNSNLGSTKNKLQSLYVATSRASKKLVILSNKNSKQKGNISNEYDFIENENTPYQSDLDKRDVRNINDLFEEASGCDNF